MRRQLDLDIISSFLTIMLTAAFVNNIVVSKGVFLYNLGLEEAGSVKNALFIGVTGILAAMAAWVSQIPIFFSITSNKQPLYAVAVLIYVVFAIFIIFVYNYIAKKYSFAQLNTSALLYFGFYPIAIAVTVINQQMYFYEAIAYSLGSGIGLYALELNMKFIRHRLDEFYPIAIAVTVINQQMYFYEAIAYSLGSGIGLYALELNMKFIRHRLDEINMPRYFRGLPINLVILGIISLALFGLLGRGSSI